MGTGFERTYAKNGHYQIVSSAQQRATDCWTFSLFFRSRAIWDRGWVAMSICRWAVRTHTTLKTSPSSDQPLIMWLQCRYKMLCCFLVKTIRRLQTFFYSSAPVQLSRADPLPEPTFKSWPSTAAWIATYFKVVHRTTVLFYFRLLHRNRSMLAFISQTSLRTYGSSEICLDQSHHEKENEWEPKQILFMKPCCTTAVYWLHR